MIKLTAYNVGCGDCIRLEFVGQSGMTRNLLIDGGFERTFRDILSKELLGIVEHNNQVDLWVITHIHDDHIGGAIGYAAAVDAGIQRDIVSKWWYNPPRVPKLVKWEGETSRAMSIGQSNTLAAFIFRTGSLLGHNISSSDEPCELDGLRISVLSPDQDGLSALAKKYADPKILLELSENSSFFEPMAARLRDYHIKAKHFDFSSWRQDGNLENAGSIVLLLEGNGCKMLLLADSHPSTVVSSLKRKGFSSANPIECDLVKVSHHGSLSNNSGELYSMISCSNYLITCDGTNKHGLAQKACIVRILTAPRRNNARRYFFYFSSEDDFLKTMFDVDGPNIYIDLNFEFVFPSHGAHLQMNL